MIDVSRSSGSPLDHCQLHDHSFASLLALICICQPPYISQSLLQPHHLSFSYPLSFDSLDSHGNGIAESSWLTVYYSNCYCNVFLFWSSSSSSILGQVPGRQPGLAGWMLFELLLVLHPQSDVVLMYDVDVFLWHLYVLCVSPTIMQWYDVMISTLQKRLQYALLSLVGPSSSFKIGSHIGHDKLVSEPRPTIGAPLFDRVVWSLSIQKFFFWSLVISESRNSFYSSAPSSLW